MSQQTNEIGKIPLCRNPAEQSHHHMIMGEMLIGIAASGCISTRHLHVLDRVLDVLGVTSAHERDLHPIGALRYQLDRPRGKITRKFSPVEHAYLELASSRWGHFRCEKSLRQAQ